MNIIANGFPKCGNHAVVKALQLLGVPARVHHLASPAEVPASMRVVFIKRDPRNVVLSWMRHQGQPTTPGMFLAHFRRFDQRSDPSIQHPLAGPLPVVMAAYEKWLTDPRTLVVAYEDLIADDQAMRRIAEFCGVPYLADAWNYLPGMTATWCADHSDWRKVWGWEVEDVWNAEGGADLLARWGYE